MLLSIPDEQIPSADPAAVVKQYEPYLQKLANRYIPALSKTGAVDMSDLIQVGRIATLDAQRKYNPAAGSFINCLFFYARKAMRYALGFDNRTGAPPVAMVYLDEPLSDETETTLGEVVSDPDELPLDEPIISEETRRETAEQIRSAVERIHSEKKRTVLIRVWFDGQKRIAVAEEMGIKPAILRQLDISARKELARDWRLKRYVKQEIPFFHVGVSRFNSTWTSATEAAVLWREGLY